MPIELPITFEAGPLPHDYLNQQFAAVLSALNDIQSQVDTLAAAAEPDLSGYATVTQVNEHIAEEVPHDLLVKWRSMTAIFGADLVEGNVVRVETALITLAAGAGTFTFDTPFANGILAAHATVHGATDNAASLDNFALNEVDVVGTDTDVVCVTVWGW